MSKGNFIDYYAILGIARTATPKEIKAGYRDMSKKWHPDRCSAPDAEEMMKLINEAWDTLRDDDKRRRYNVTYDIFAEARKRQAQQEKEEEERKRREAENQARQQREEEERKRQEAENRARRQREEEERLRKEAEERARREMEERERKRREEEERKRQMEIMAAIERMMRNPNVLTASRTQLRKGKRESAMLAWDLSDVARHKFRARIYADSGNRFDISEAKGALSISPDRTTTYKMEIYVEGVFVFSREKTISVDPEAEVKFTSEFSHVLKGTTFRLAWDVRDAQSVEIEGFGPQPAKGSMEMSIDRDTTFRLVATDAFGGKTASVSVCVMPRALAQGVKAPQPRVSLKVPNAKAPGMASRPTPTPLAKAVELKATAAGVNMPNADISQTAWQKMDIGRAIDEALAKVRETINQNIKH